MQEEEYYLKWIEKADEDLIVVEHELSYPDEEIPTGAVCFHAQQCVEKLLKAYLVFNNKEFGRTHNLEYLLQQCSEYNKDFLNIFVGDLSFYAVEVRYPDDFYAPSVNEARDCYAIAQNIRDFVLKELKKT